MVAGLAIASMVAGNLIALAQRSLKRMLAYSSIAHAGYMLVAVWTGTQEGAGAVLFYLLAYGLTTLASFGFLTALGRGGERDVTYDDIAGLAPTRPWIALGLSVCMLSLLGFPGTVGFIGKWYILTATVAEGQMILPVILVLTSVLSAGYYLPVIMAMYMRPAPAAERHAGVRLSPTAAGLITVSIVAVILFGLWPNGAAGPGDLQRPHPDADRLAGGGADERPQVDLPPVRRARAGGHRAHPRLRPGPGPRLRQRRVGASGPRARASPSGATTGPPAPHSRRACVSGSPTPAAPRWTWARCRHRRCTSPSRR